MTENRNGINVIPLRNAVCGVNMPYWVIMKANDNEMFLSGDAADKLAYYERAEAEGKMVEVVRCKDCVHFIPKHVLMANGERRPYTEEEKKSPFGVTCDVGINCGSVCERYDQWEQNRIPVFVGNDDFCSYGKRREQA